MAHNDDAVTLFDKVAQGVGDDTAAHMTALFDTVGDTSVEFKAVYGLDSRLVAASDLYVAMTRPTQKLVIVRTKADEKSLNI